MRYDTVALGRAGGTDYFCLDELLTPDERAVRDRVRRFCDDDVIPVINGYWERAEFPFDLVPRIASLGIAGGTLRGHGCAGLSALASGVVSMELGRGDASIATFVGVHSGLAMGAIGRLGSEEQRARWLPAMARFERIGAFALTEPDHGSDAVALETRARRDGGHYVIDGHKRWIGNASFADVVVVWARDDDGEVGGFVVERGTPGYQATVITGKTSKRAVWQADVRLDSLRVPVENRLAEARTFRDTAKVLAATRLAVGWEALGHAIAVYEVAQRYTQEREQFGQPLAAFQIVQQRLAWMLAEITAMQTLTTRAAQLADQDALTDAQSALVKMHNAAKARAIVADARDLLGGNGILLDFHVARHQADMEAVVTYEGTDTIQSLIVGREITGHQAFAPPRPGRGTAEKA